MKSIQYVSAKNTKRKKKKRKRKKEKKPTLANQVCHFLP